jgi:hypothetical protein
LQPPLESKLLEQLARPGLRRLDDLVSARGDILHSRSGPLQRALHGGDTDVEHRGHIRGRERQHVAQQKHRALLGRKVLKARDQRQPKALPRSHDDGRIVDPRIGNHLQPRHIHCGLGR